MYVNFQAWDNFLGRSLIVFLLIEGLKTFPAIYRASSGSVAFSLFENLAANLVLVLLSVKTGSDIFMGDNVWVIALSVAMGSLATAGLHRIKQAFERRSPADFRRP